MSIKWLIMIGIASAVLLSSQLAVASTEESTGAAAASGKAARGLVNAGMGVVIEVPKTVYYDTLEDGLLYGLTAGVLEGVSWGIARTLVGIYEIVTFPFPLPEGYRSIYDPHYPFEAGKTDLAE